MFEIHVQTRGPEGVNGISYKVSEADYDELKKRIADKAPLVGLLDGIAEAAEESKPGA